MFYLSIYLSIHSFTYSFIQKANRKRKYFNSLVPKSWSQGRTSRMSGTQSRTHSWVSGTQLLQSPLAACQRLHWQGAGAGNQRWELKPGYWMQAFYLGTSRQNTNLFAHIIYIRIYKHSHHSPGEQLKVHPWYLAHMHSMSTHPAAASGCEVMVFIQSIILLLNAETL